MNPSRGWDARSVESLVSQVTDEYLERLERGEQPDHEDYARRHPQIAAVLRQVLPALGALRSPPIPALPAEPAIAPGPLPGGPLGDYRILREIGRGGMGVVYEAEQLSLGRQVALKVLPLAAALDARALQRFKNEARAAAQLHHPNIVPVIGVGCERGVHYYAMQYIEGQNLAAMIDALRRSAKPRDPDGVTSIHMQRPAPPRLPPSKTCEVPPTVEGTVPRADRAAAFLRWSKGGKNAQPGAATTELSTSSPAYLRTVVRLALQAAQALAYAHEVGVLHRDIKPGNLMIDGRGNLWITDFGLAQIRADPRLTASGDLMGTLRYMSPEQALGKPGAVDHRSDIYSLGATLYELLTLSPLYNGEQKEELLWQIGSEDPIPPRRLNKAIPAELATIVQNAIARNPAERYASAQDLAVDLQRFLEDKPIRARPPTLEQRLARWCRRHKPIVWSVTISSVLVLLLTVGILAVSNQKIQGALAAVQTEQQKTAAAHRQEAEQRQRAEANLDLVIRALDETGLRPAELLLPQDPVAVQQQLDRNLLLRILPLYEQLAKVNGSEPIARLTRGRAYRRLGVLHQELGQHQQADEAFRQAVTQLEQLAAESSLSGDLAYELIHSWWGRGQTLRVLLRTGEAEEAYRRGLACCEQCLANEANDPQRLSEQAGLRHNLAALASDRGAMNLAIPLLEQAIQGQRQSLGMLPHDRTFRERFGAHLLAIGFSLNRSGRTAEACTAYRESIRTFEELATSHRTFLPYQGRVALGLARLAAILDDQAQLQEADAFLTRSVGLYETLVAATPAVPAYRLQLGMRLLDLANVQLRAGNRTEAERTVERARAREDEFAMEFSSGLLARSTSGLYFSNLGELQNRLNQPRPAHESFRRALQLLLQAFHDSPSPTQRLHLAITQHRLAVLLQEQRRWTEAGNNYRQAIDLWRPLCTEFPQVAEYQCRLGRSLRNLAMVTNSRGAPAEARVLLDEAIGLHEALHARQPEHPLYRYYLGLEWCDRGDLLFRAGDHAGAGINYEKARLLDATLVADRPGMFSYTRQLARALSGLASCRQKARKPAEAWPLLEEAIRHQETVVTAVAQRRHELDLLAYQAALTSVLLELKRPADAIAALTREIAVRQKLLTDHGEDAELRHQQIGAWLRLGNLHNDLKQPAPAEQAYRQALPMLEQLPEKQAQAIGAALARTRTLGRLAELLLLQNRPEEARRTLEEAVRGKDLATVQSGSQEQRLLRTHYGQLMKVLVQLEEHAAAVAAADKHVQLSPTGQEEVYRSSVAVIRCMHLAQKDPLLSEEERIHVIERYGKRARQVLDELGRRANHSPAADNELAWFLLTSTAAQLRDPQEAVRLARRATQGAPREGNYWNTLALACYRTANWQEAATASQRAIELHRGQDPFDGLVQAMIDWQLQRPAAAQGWLGWTNALLRAKPVDDPAFIALRTEAEQLFGRGSHRNTPETAASRK